MINQRILEALRKIRDEGPSDRTLGICSLTAAILIRNNTPFGILTVYAHLEPLFKMWPLCVEPEYPVDGREGFITQFRQCTLWNNPRRHELLHWLISYMENEVCPQ